MPNKSRRDAPTLGTVNSSGGSGGGGGRGRRGGGGGGGPGDRGLARGGTGHHQSSAELVRRLKSSRARHERQRALAELAASPHHGQLTAHAYTVVIATAGRDNGWRDALRWLDIIAAEHSLDVFHYSAAINACAKGRQWEQAMLLLDTMNKNGVPPDCVCFNGAISACARGGHWERALGLLDDMKLKGHKPNLISYSSAISACSKGGCWERALQLLHEMRQAGHWPNVISYSAAISACDKGGQWERALALLQEMINLGLEADVVSYNAAISACTKGRQWAAALSLLQQMRQGGIAPNVITYNAAISACEKGDQWMRALMLLDEMRQAGNRPDVVSYNASIGACDRGAQGKRAVGLLQEMRRSGIPLEVASYSGAISACAKEEGGLPTALKLWREMHEVHLVPTEACSLCVFAACKRMKLWQPAIAVLQQVEQLGRSPPAGMYRAAVEICTAAGQLCQARTFRRKAEAAEGGAATNTKSNDFASIARDNLISVPAINPQAEITGSGGGIEHIGTFPPQAIGGAIDTFAAVAANPPKQQPSNSSRAAWTSASSSAAVLKAASPDAMTPVTWSTAAVSAPEHLRASSEAASFSVASYMEPRSGEDLMGSTSEWRLTAAERDRAVAMAPVGNWLDTVRTASWKATSANRAAAESMPPMFAHPDAAQSNDAAIVGAKFSDQVSSEEPYSARLQSSLASSAHLLGEIKSRLTPGVSEKRSPSMMPIPTLEESRGHVNVEGATSSASASELNVDAQPYYLVGEDLAHLILDDGTSDQSKG